MDRRRIPYDTPAVTQVNPQRFLSLLERTGWKIVGGRTGMYARLSPPSSTVESNIRRRFSVVLPLDTTADDFAETMAAALTETQSLSTRESWLTEILPRLRSDPADSFRFRKESNAPPGLIPWKTGEELISAARGTLIAGAKAYLDPLRRYSNRHGQFASRYLDGVLMGQTAVGSYIVTALAPTQTPVNLANNQVDTPVIPGLEVVQARSVTRSISQALEASAEALHHYKKTGSFSAFEAGVRQGFSYDLSVALKGVTEESEGGDIILEWDPADVPTGVSERFTFEFYRDDYKIFDEVATKFAEDTQAPVTVQIFGRVHLLTKKNRGGPGVFGMETISTPTRKYRVRLSDPEQYHLAVNAHDADLGLTVTGSQERDGSLTWLYNAQILGTVTIDTTPAIQVQNKT